jgi:SAM-dependent methyltransferase
VCSQEQFVERDVQNFAPRIYAESAPRVLGDQHRLLLSALEAHLSTKEAPTLLVLGCGGEVLPYSFQYRDGLLNGSNVVRVHAMMKNGRMILVDVSDSEERGLVRSQRTLAHCGFFDGGRFRACRAGRDTFVPEGPVHADAHEPRSVVFLQQNLRDPLLVADESVDAIDANLTLHHVTQTREHMSRAYGDLHRALKPGGLLHIGEGNVDMNHSERKLCRLAADIAEILGKEVTVQDDRDPAHRYFYLVAPHTTDSVLHSTPPGEAEIRVSDEGVVHLQPLTRTSASGVSPTNEALVEALGRRGYRQLVLMADHVVLPLIDPLMASDRDGLIDGVDRFYSAIAERCPMREMQTALRVERGRAARGIVEYYMGESSIVDALGSAGFDDIRVARESEPFYNVLAKKPVSTPST